MRTILFIGPAERARIQEIREYAEHNRIPAGQVWRNVSNQFATGNNPMYRMEIPLDYSVVYSIEQGAQHKQTNEMQWCRILSCARKQVGSLPAPEVMAYLMKEFGFKSALVDCAIQFQQIGPNHEAIIVAELIE